MSVRKTLNFWFVAITFMLLVSGCGGTPEPAAPVPGVEAPTPERHVALDGQPNFRDLGGYQTAD